MLTKRLLLKILLFIGVCGYVMMLTFFTLKASKLQILQKELPNEPSPQFTPMIMYPSRPWYFLGGGARPKKSKKKFKLFSEELAGDRIIEQLMYIPENYDANSLVKTILLPNNFEDWNVEEGMKIFKVCPVYRCSLTNDIGRSVDADAILFKNYVTSISGFRPLNQTWIIYLLECPYHSRPLNKTDLLNWTATYRQDSDIVIPYERWAYYDPQITQQPQTINYAANKTKQVAWFVSNCNANNDRIKYAMELSKYISVDIYGSCGTLSCPRYIEKTCFKLLKDTYKFYLSFENSNCQDYITEKLYKNALLYNVLPIVMGARPEEYKRSAPKGSYIHVDYFEGPKELAKFLQILDENDELYNKYFRWKGTGELINTYFWCRLCAMLHAPIQKRYYSDISEWWSGPEICWKTQWKKGKQIPQSSSSPYRFKIFNYSSQSSTTLPEFIDEFIR